MTTARRPISANQKYLPGLYGFEPHAGGGRAPGGPAAPKRLAVVLVLPGSGGRRAAENERRGRAWAKPAKR